MQFLIPETINLKSKYYPRHFDIIARKFGEIEWHSSLASVEPGQWALVVRSPGSRGLSRTTAPTVGIACAFDLLTDNELQAIRTKAGRIVLDLGWEILNPTMEIVSGLFSTLSELGIDASQVFLFHSNQGARRKFNDLWRQIAATPPPLSIEYPVGLALFVIHQEIIRDDAIIENRRKQAREKTENDERSRLFVSFNGEVRPHRLYIGAALESLNILDRGYFSLVYPKKKAEESREAFHVRSLKWFDKLPRGREFVGSAKKLLNSLPLRLDLSALPIGNIEELAWTSQDPFYYDDSRFTIVVDTAVFENDCLFVTEKVLKPIMNHSPFLLVGSLGAANLLRSYGFRTFEPFLRQGEASSPKTMLTSSIDEIMRISILDEIELRKFSRGLAAICDYNAAHFWNGFPLLLRHQFRACLAALGPKLSAYPAVDV